MIATFIKGYEAAAGVNGNRILAFTGDGSKVSAAASNTAKLMGVGDRMGAVAGGLVDAVQGGYADVRLGGTVAAGDLATSDATGRAVKAVPVASANVATIGQLMAPGVEGDIVPILVVPGVLAKPAA